MHLQSTMGTCVSKPQRWVTWGGNHCLRNSITYCSPVPLIQPASLLRLPRLPFFESIVFLTVSLAVSVTNHRLPRIMFLCYPWPKIPGHCHTVNQTHEFWIICLSLSFIFLIWKMQITPHIYKVVFRSSWSDHFNVQRRMNKWLFCYFTYLQRTKNKTLTNASVAFQSKCECLSPI